jgi:lactate dehydrogenase-like 2-hydroxyacid dehydrogenase
MTYRCAIIDDYQNVALKLADWSKVTKDVEIKVFTEAVRRSDADTINDLKDCDIVVMMRERTRFPRAVIDGMPKLKLLITTGAYNASIDMKACAERGIVVCGTGGFGNPTTGITFGLILELTRRIGWEHARMKSGVPWQNTLGMDIEGKTSACWPRQTRRARRQRRQGVRHEGDRLGQTDARALQRSASIFHEGRSVPQRRRRDHSSCAQRPHPGLSPPTSSV